MEACENITPEWFIIKAYCNGNPHLFQFNANSSGGSRFLLCFAYSGLWTEISLWEKHFPCKREGTFTAPTNSPIKTEPLSSLAFASADLISDHIK